VAYALDGLENCTGLPRTIREKMGHQQYQSVICSRLTHVRHFRGILHRTPCEVLECAMLEILKQLSCITPIFSK
jgi:hypothetical protein